MSSLVIRGFFGNLEIASETFETQKISQWTGSKCYSGMYFCDLEIHKKSSPKVSAKVPKFLSHENLKKKIENFEAYQEKIQQEIENANAEIEEAEKALKFEEEAKKEVEESKDVFLKNYSKKKEGGLADDTKSSREVAIQNMQQVTSASRGVCIYHLENANWNLEAACTNHFELNDRSSRQSSQVFIKIFLPSGKVVSELFSPDKTVQQFKKFVQSLLPDKSIAFEVYYKGKSLGQFDPNVTLAILDIDTNTSADFEVRYL